VAENVSDEVFARYVNQIGNATLEQIETAKAAQAQSAGKGVLLSLGEALVQQGVLTAAMRENVEKKLQAQQTGGTQKLGNYRLIRKLGEGGMGAVYLAEDLSVGRMVAVKVLPKRSASDPDFLARFRREAKAAGALNHVNIVGAYTTGEDLGYHYLAMEYCEGDALDKVLKRDGKLPWDKALEIIVQVARGLKHAHDHGFIHRDIKPANIMLCKPLSSAGSQPATGDDAGRMPAQQDGVVAKILDLGLSKNVDGGEESFVTHTNVALGTPHYISPEQAKGDKDIDGRTDIYSLGATFYHLVTGQTPFQGSTSAIIMAQHINRKLPNPQNLNAEVPDGVVHVIQKMMAKKPSDRYGDCQELLDDLAMVRDGKTPSRTPGPVPQVGMLQHVPVDRRGTGQQAADQVEPGNETPPSSKKNLYIAAGFGALAVLTLVIGLVVSGSRSGEQRAAVRAADDKRKAEADATARLAEQRRMAEESRLKNEAARLEEERRKVSENKRKAEEARFGEEKRKLAEERQKLEEARLAAKAEAKQKAEALKTEPGAAAVQPNMTSPKVDEAPAVQAEAPAAKAQRLFSGVLKETSPLLAQNKLADAISLLERKAKDPALADAAELIKQEQAGVESVVELRKAALEALRKQVGQQLTLKKGGTEFKGKVVNEPKPDSVTLDMGGAQMTFSAMQLSLEDVDQYAPRTGNAGADLRQRGIMYLAAGNLAKAKEYFSKPQTFDPGRYLGRITAIETGEIEAAALKAWERAEKLFAAKDMIGAKALYGVFERDHGKTQTAAKQAPALKQRYEAMEKVIGPAPQLLEAKPQELGDVAAGRKPVNLLALVEPQRDAVFGAWQRNPATRELLSDSSELARIEIPYQPPAEYDFEIQFTRVAGFEYVAQFAVQNGHQFAWLMGAFGNTMSGFEQVSRKGLRDHPNTIRAESCLTNGKRYSSVLQVRKDGLTVYLNGILLTFWKTDGSNLTLGEWTALRHKTTMGLSTYRSPTIFHAANLYPVTGQGKVVDVTPATPGATDTPVTPPAPP